MANSLIAGCVKTGMKISVASPSGFKPDEELVKWGEESGLLTLTSDPFEAAENADVIYTDVWASMGQEGEAEERKKSFQKLSGK